MELAGFEEWISRYETGGITYDPLMLAFLHVIYTSHFLDNFNCSIGRKTVRKWLFGNGIGSSILIIKFALISVNVNT